MVGEVGSGTTFQGRPAGAPSIGIPSYGRLRDSIRSRGIARIIVRFAGPASEASGFPLDARLGKADAAKQRSEIGRLQEKLLSRVSATRANAAKRFDFIPFMALEVDSADLQSLIASPEIDFIEEDVIVKPLLGQSVPLIGGVSEAFNGFTGDGQTVATLDTGVEKSHPFLTGKVVAEGCFSTTSAGTSVAYCSPYGSTASGSGLPCSDSATGCYHGTHVAGIVAGNNGPTAAPSGVAKDSTLIAVQVFSQFSGTGNCGSDTTCPQAYSSDLISALQYIYSLRNTYSISSVNMSLGGGEYSESCDSSFPSFKAAVDNLRLAGIATVVSSGNNSYTDGISFPACISTAISVGATSKSDVVASYSNSATFLKLLAPGSSIYSSLLNSGYGYLSGTSMAAPHVAGAWAVLKSANTSASVTEVLNALINSGTSITDSRNGIAKPRIQIDLAVYRIEGLLPINGVCGGADGQTFDNAPTADLCSAGTPSALNGSGPWDWSCVGMYGGTTENCSADITTFTTSSSVTGGVGGSITASASTVPYGGSVTFTITPDSGYTLSTLTDNGAGADALQNQDGSYSYTIGNVTANHTVIAAFAASSAVAVPAMPPFGVSAVILFGVVFGCSGFSRRKNSTVS